MLNYSVQYNSKLRTPEEAVKVVKSGDWVDYTTASSMPVLLDKALAKRKEELSQVKIRGNLLPGPVHVAECDPEKKHFVYNTWHCSPYERRLCDQDMCYYIPMVFHNLTAYYHFFIDVDVAMVSLPPMDKHGYFNFSLNTGTTAEILRQAKTVIVEVNEHLPNIRGGYDDCIHISEVDMVVEGHHDPFPIPKAAIISPEEKTIAENLIPYIKNGSTLQIGIGAMPDAIGQLLADSELKDLGMHTELCTDAYLKLHDTGKLTNRYKNIDRGKGVLGFAIGSPDLYEWLDNNPSIKAYPLEYVNKPDVIGQIDNMVSINSCISVDLYGQVSSESVGTRQISGTGGQLDFLEGASISRGGKSFICVKSTYTDKDGKLHSSIVPYFNGDIITSPRSQVYYIATEYGVVNLEGQSTWERAEKLISIAHPDFRADLEQAAIQQKIFWKR
ncbi:MAG: butyryl-CoA:acetate CoA-transferase [Selenomonadales bacterium]|nr:butyryl-CoA:acetate CoA-transferase [Selenomonadales bacterium]MDD6218446.1 acetyl-CoA hydrolase/transferase C-terminal domain-containing protein [Selenomonadaceae bacterium]